MPCSNQPCVLLHPPEQGSVNGAIMWVLVQDNDIGGGQQGVSHIIIAGMLDDLHQHNKAWIAAVALDCIHPCMGVMCLRRAQRLLAQHLPAQSSALPLACTPPPPPAQRITGTTRPYVGEVVYVQLTGYKRCALPSGW